jgi:hypothetical protein
MTDGSSTFRVPRSWWWTAAYFGALAMMVADANLALLRDPWHLLLKVLVVILLVPMLVSGLRQERAEGPTSPAFRNLGARTLAGVGGCVLVFSVSAAIYRDLQPGSAVLWPLALVTAVPVLWLVWAMGQYLAEESDEYLRHLATMSALIGLAAVLVVATVWGFLEALELVPHVPAWYAVPLFAVANGVGRGWLKARSR